MRAGAPAVILAVLLTALPAAAQPATASGSETANTPAEPAKPAEAPPAPAATPAPATPASPAAPAPPAPPPNKYRAADGELRAAALIGAAVYNDQKQNIGTVSDLLLNKEATATKAILSVGGFLGVGSRLVAVPFTDLRVEPDRIVLPSATKVSLENLSAYQAAQ